MVDKVKMVDNVDMVENIGDKVNNVLILDLVNDDVCRPSWPWIILARPDGTWFDLMGIQSVKLHILDISDISKILDFWTCFKSYKQEMELFLILSEI